MTEPDDLGALMRAAQAGDRDAYEALLHAVTPVVRRTVSRQRGFAGPDAVEDLVQDILLSVHAARATYDPSRPFTPWLHAIVRHRLADGARRYARRESHEVPLEGDGDVTLVDRAANVLPEGPEDVEALRAAVQRLPPGQRQAIELLKFRELSLKEAARASGTTVGALKVASHRGMAALRRALTKTTTHDD